MAKHSHHSSTAPQGENPYERVKVEDLYFDSKNPRLVEFCEGGRPKQDAGSTCFVAADGR